MNDETYTRIVIQLARIEERQMAMTEAAEHRHNNLKMSLEGMATKKDFETTNERIVNLKTDHAARIATLEGNQARVVWALLGTMGGVVVNLLGLGKKLGF
jgi:hypothetical protein